VTDLPELRLSEEINNPRDCQDRSENTKATTEGASQNTNAESQELQLQPNGRDIEQQEPPDTGNNRETPKVNRPCPRGRRNTPSHDSQAGRNVSESTPQEAPSEATPTKQQETVTPGMQNLDRIVDGRDQTTPRRTTTANNSGANPQTCSSCHFLRAEWNTACWTSRPGKRVWHKQKETSK
jgi:hypothetical protein